MCTVANRCARRRRGWRAPGGRGRRRDSGLRGEDLACFGTLLDGDEEVHVGGQLVAFQGHGHFGGWNYGFGGIYLGGYDDPDPIYCVGKHGKLYICGWN